MVFDRKEEESGSGGVYVHADRWLVIYRICRLLDSQVEELVEFLFCESGSGSCPLPILPTEENLERVDPEQAIEITGVYRDPWERRLRPLQETDRRTRDVVDTFNYLSKEDWRAARGRASKERQERARREGRVLRR